jgi:hypothetical protein
MIANIKGGVCSGSGCGYGLGGESGLRC